MNERIWLPIFVYGTLKRGEVREHSWPHAPTSVASATVSGLLYDLGPYPALREGEGCVGGELWFIRESHFARTLRVLDRIEGYTGGPNDLYVRRTAVCSVESQDHSLQQHTAYTYHYGNTSQLDRLTPIAPGADGCSRWFGDANKVGD